MSRRSGFTLTEVAVAIALVLALVVALFGFYFYAMDVQKDVVGDAELLTAERSIMDGLTNELRAAMAYPFLNIGMEGTSGQISFVSTALPGPAVWATPDPMAQPPPPEQDVQILTYRLRVDANTDPVTVLGLERLCRKNVSAIAPDRGLQVRLLSPQMQFLYFRFFDGTSWQDSWHMEASGSAGDPQQAAALPMGVEITLGTEPKPADMDLEEYLKNNRTFRREIFVPAGARPLSGTIVRDSGASLP
jgi:prepilin-type N-terminal cleavage/methylation domain-containing protein